MNDELSAHSLLTKPLLVGNLERVRALFDSQPSATELLRAIVETLKNYDAPGPAEVLELALPEFAAREAETL